MTRLIAHTRAIADNLPGRITRWAEQSRDAREWAQRATDGEGEGPWLSALFCLLAGCACVGVGLLSPNASDVLLWVGLVQIVLAGLFGGVVVRQALRR